MSVSRTMARMVVAVGFHWLAAAIVPADEPQSRTFDANGVKIHYLTQGKGEPLV